MKLKNALVTHADGLDRIIQLTPGFDLRDPDPSKNYGVGSCRVMFVVAGQGGAVHFLLLSGWYPVSVEHESQAMAADLGYHWKRPQYDDHAVDDAECQFTGGACYYDGSGLNAERPWRILREEGLDALWDFLTVEYYERVAGTDEGGHHGP